MGTIADSLAIAAAHREAGRVGAARTVCRQIIEIEPLHPEPWNELGLLAFDEGRTAQAGHLFSRAVARDPFEPRYIRNQEKALAALTEGEDDRDIYIRGYAAWKHLRVRHDGEASKGTATASASGQMPMDPPTDHRREIHIINPLINPAGGSEWHALCLCRELSPHARVTLWSESDFSAQLLAEWPVHQISRIDYPRHGTIIFLGIYFDVGPWVRVAQPRRNVVVYNTFDPGKLMRRFGEISQDQPREIELVFGTERTKLSVGLRGTVITTSVDLERFPPKRAPSQSDADDTFTIGRLSRDVPVKHHPGDPKLYQRLAGAGCSVRLMGGTCLATAIANTPGIELLPTLSQSASVFLRSLDCFFYRTGIACEAGGRVILEAMASALPVVCHRVGGYAEWIEHGRTGFLFESDDEAFRILTRLKTDPDLRRRVGEAARGKVESLFSAQNRQRLIDYYLR